MLATSDNTSIATEEDRWQNCLASSIMVGSSRFTSERERLMQPSAVLSIYATGLCIGFTSACGLYWFENLGLSSLKQREK